MKCDVFISYSRKDIVQAESLCKALTAAGVDYWIDRNIHGSANFLTEITHYISSCKVVLFIASANSAESEWTQKEVLFALKHHKEILPYRIGNFSFENNPELDFIFTNIQWIESEREVIASLGKLGCCGKTQPQTASAKTYETREEAERTAREDVERRQRLGIYEVGDYYNDGVREGVVFEISADSRHGKIVSIVQPVMYLQWATEERKFGLFKSEAECIIGADSETDGAYNMAKVKSISGWRDKYPAFKWCADLGEGWYLPSIEELKTLTLNDAVHDAVNCTLIARGGAKLYDRGEFNEGGENVLYWSSTEHDYKFSDGGCCAWIVGMATGYACSLNKSSYGYVCAVSAF